MHSDGATFLLQADELEDVATAIGGRGVMDNGEYYLRRVTLDEALEKEPDDGAYRAALC